MGAPGPLGHRQVLLQLLARRWLDCFVERFQLGDNISLRPPQRGPSGHNGGVRTSNGIFRGRGAGCGALVRVALVVRWRRSEGQLATSSPLETVAALTRHCRTHAPPQVRAGDHQLPQYLWGRRRPPRYAPSPSFWSTWGRPKQDFCASLRTQPRATRANRAQSTAHH